MSSDTCIESAERMMTGHVEMEETKPSLILITQLFISGTIVFRLS